ncbi:TetR/AcrR family transcriptional regulator [Mameliella sediminis]|uniref:TetR/AcrR family transcriptional regulator n=1 Tax=Mameliella sediminis TaxID=2836866 RepID=UPI001C439F04|nr:TetR/AcrR family transcriptional regulator [Mameliella sediminis]MBV7397230.1 TetR/AcrR family transcriptional regulator [Mameliella sediminis]MBY6163594.1 TetR/AcrR family transcriptional regulator [Mameliella alba]MBY6172075.1 TetR/AcrR family transcriptional regulator [Mameliella alba]MBY6177082.1 TetR/AcrR family transcriptional regulator [Mameliella alba]
MSDCFKPHAGKYAAIIEAAVAEFQEKGFGAASMDRIAARSEVSKRTLYKYFESKENLFRSIVAELSERFSGLCEFGYVRGRPIRQQLTDLAWAEARLLLTPDVIAMARMIISETLRSPELAAEAQGKLEHSPVFAELLRDAGADGVLNIDDPDDAASNFLALIKSRAFWPAVMTGTQVSEERMGEIVESSVDFMLCRYGVTPPAI